MKVHLKYFSSITTARSADHKKKKQSHPPFFFNGNDWRNNILCVSQYFVLTLTLSRGHSFHSSLNIFVDVKNEWRWISYALAMTMKNITLNCFDDSSLTCFLQPSHSFLQVCSFWRWQSIWRESFLLITRISSSRTVLNDKFLSIVSEHKEVCLKKNPQTHQITTKRKLFFVCHGKKNKNQLTGLLNESGLTHGWHWMNKSGQKLLFFVHKRW